MTSGIGNPQIQICGFRDISVAAQVSDYAYVAALGILEYVGRVTAKQLAGAFEKQSFGRRQNSSDGGTGVVDAILTSNQIAAHHGPIDPGQHMIVKSIDFAEGRTHLARPGYDPAGQGSEGDVSLFQVDALFSKGQKEVTAGIRIDDRLHSQLRFVHLHDRRRHHAIAPGGRNEIADHADIRI